MPESTDATDKMMMFVSAFRQLVGRYGLHGHQRNESGKVIFEIDLPPAKQSEPPSAD